MSLTAAIRAGRLSGERSQEIAGRLLKMADGLRALGGLTLHSTGAVSSHVNVQAWVPFDTVDGDPLLAFGWAASEMFPPLGWTEEAVDRWSSRGRTLYGYWWSRSASSRDFPGGFISVPVALPASASLAVFARAEEIPALLIARAQQMREELELVEAAG